MSQDKQHIRFEDQAKKTLIEFIQKTNDSNRLLLLLVVGSLAQAGILKGEAEA